MPQSASKAPQEADFSFESRQIGSRFHLHLNRSTTRKTHRICLFWVNNLEREGLTARSLLPSVLMRGTESLPNMQKVTQHLEGLYGTGLSADVQKLGERHLVTFRTEFVSDSYLPGDQGLFAQVVQLLTDLISKPYLEDGKFPEAVLEQEKSNHARYLRSLIDDKRAYAFERCLRTLCSDEAYKLYEYGYEEDLDAITSDDLLQLLHQGRNESEVHLYFSGDMDLDEAAAALKPLIDAHDANFKPQLTSLAELKSATDKGEIIEEMDVQQSQLFLAYRTKTRYGSDRAVALSMLGGILGNFSHSKLFMNVREEANLCYSVGSELNRSQGLMFMSAGIEAEKYEQARDLMKEQLQQIIDGDISDEEMEATRRAFANRLQMLEDSPATLMEIDLNWRLAGASYDHENYKKKLLSVSKEEVVEAAKCLELELTYFLRPKAEA